jgi:hypothetical protein
MAAPSKLDFSQVLPASYDDVATALRVTGTGAGGAVTVTGSGGSLVTETYDNIALTYVTSGNGIGEIETVTYKLGATPVATLTLAYDGSDRLSTVTKS